MEEHKLLQEVTLNYYINTYRLKVHIYLTIDQVFINVIPLTPTKPLEKNVCVSNIIEKTMPRCTYTVYCIDLIYNKRQSAGEFEDKNVKEVENILVWFGQIMFLTCLARGC